MGSEEDIEIVESQLSPDKLDMAQVIFLEIRDCDKSLGTPEYPEKVKALLRKARTHPKIIQHLEDFDNEIDSAKIEVEDIDAEVNNRWQSDNPVESKIVYEKDWEVIESIILKWLARYHVTWKKQERDDL